MKTPDEGRIVVGIANTVSGYQALRFAVAYARQQGAPLVVVRAMPITAVTETLPAARRALFEEATEDILNAFTEALGLIPQGVSITMKVRSGPAAEVLLSIADRPNDLLVIGRSDSCWRLPWLAARTNQRVMRRAVCPVVAVPASELAQRDSRRVLGRRLVHDVDDFLRHSQQTGTRM